MDALTDVNEIPHSLMAEAAGNATANNDVEKEGTTAQSPLQAHEAERLEALRLDTAADNKILQEKATITDIS